MKIAALRILQRRALLAGRGRSDNDPADEEVDFHLALANNGHALLNLAEAACAYVHNDPRGQSAEELIADWRRLVAAVDALEVQP